MGKYVNNHLIKNEEVVFETRFHWVIFLTLRSLFTLTIYPLLWEQGVAGSNPATPTFENEGVR